MFSFLHFSNCSKSSIGVPWKTINFPASGTHATQKLWILNQTEAASKLHVNSLSDGRTAPKTPPPHLSDVGYFGHFSCEHPSTTL